jgi:tripartite-type tricarboxylate transporter receptor subunit TctC
MLHVPYKGGGPALLATIAGQTQICLSSLIQAIGHIRSGKLRALATSTATRSATLPDVPTISEAGVPGYESENWFGMFAPAKTPKRIVARLNEAVVKVVRTPEIQSQFAALGADAVGNTPEEFAAFIRRDMQQYAKVVRLSGAKLD